MCNTSHFTKLLTSQYNNINRVSLTKCHLCDRCYEQCNRNIIKVYGCWHFKEAFLSTWERDSEGLMTGHRKTPGELKRSTLLLHSILFLLCHLVSG